MAKFIIKSICFSFVVILNNFVLFASDTLNFNLLTIDHAPRRTWINWIIENDTSLIINISANNYINDSLYAGWVNIDPSTYLEDGNNRYELKSVDGIATAPDFTRFNRPNQTISFNLIFPRIKQMKESFNLIENDSSDWNFNGIKLRQHNGNMPNIYYAPHTYAQKIYYYSDSLMRISEYEEAIEINSKALAYIIQEGIIADNLLSTISYSLAGCYNRINNDSSAVEYAQSVINFYRSNHWKDDIPLARMYGVLADVYARNNNFNQAIKQGEIALSLKKALNPGSFDLATSYGKLAFYYEKIGNYDQAIHYAEKGLLLREEYAESEINNRIPVVLNLCRNYYIKNRYADAYNLAFVYKTEQIKESDIDAYIQLCAVCSHSQYNMGNVQKSILYAKEGYELLNKNEQDYIFKLQNFLDFLSTEDKIQLQEQYLKDSPKDERYFGIMQNLSSNYFELGAINEALKRQELCQRERKSFSVHDIAKECEGQNHLMIYYLYSNEIDSFLHYKDKCFKQTEEVFGKYSYEYAELLKANYKYYYDSQNFYEAILDLNRMLDIYKYLIVRDFSLLSYDDREIIWKSYNEWFNSVFLDCSIRALESNLSLAGEINALLYNNLLFSKGLLLNSQIAHNAYNSLSNTLIDRMQSGDSISSFLKNSLYGSYSDIINELDSESIAIEMFDDNNTGEIIALCLLQDRQNPLLVYICKKNELNELLNKNASINDYNSLIWSNLAKYLNGKTKIYISLDGILNIVPIENYASDCIYFEPHTTIYRVSSTRNVIYKTQKEIDNYLLIGGLDYKVNGYNPYGDLLETQQEINDISEIFKKNRISYSMITETGGTKDSIEKQIQDNYSAIHFSTHAYYWVENRIPQNNIGKLVNILSNKKHDTDIKLIRSGLVLSSDVNNNLGSELLSSYEIAALNLSDVQLIVLPNCKSGSGDITDDGIIGLQRAFKEAQAGTILMSLWDADDVATRILMVEFYKNYVKGKSLHDSLKEAIIYIKNYKDNNGNILFESPYYWAGFVLLD